MKLFFISILSLILVAFSGTVLAGENEHKATDKEEFFGTWVNMDYTGGWPPQIIAFKLGGGSHRFCTTKKTVICTWYPQTSKSCTVGKLGQV